jgi:hypothetical protein
VSVVETAGRDVGPDTEPSEPPSPSSGGPRGTDLADRVIGFFRRRTVGLVVAVLSGIGLTVAIQPPPIYADAYWIWRAAQLWPNIEGNYPPNLLHHAMRLGTIFPTRVAQEIFGEGQTAWVVAAAFLMVLFALGAYTLGRALFTNWIGYATLGILLIHPFFTVVDTYNRAYSTGTGSLVPDAPSAGLFAMGVAAVAVASRRGGRRQVAWLLGAGLLWGAAYLTREYVAFMYLAVPVFFLALRIPLRRIVWPAITMLACLAFEFIHNAIVWGDPFARLTVAGEHGGPIPQPLAAKTVLMGFVRAIRADQLGYLFAICLLLTVVGALVFRDRRLWMILAWFASLWLPLTILGGLINPSEPSIRPQLVRYWYLVFPPLVAGGVATLDMFVKRVGTTSRARVIASVAVAAVIAGAYVGPALTELPRVRRDADWRELRAWLQTHQDARAIHTDYRTAETLTFYVRDLGGNLIWNGEVEELQTDAPTSLATQIGADLYLRSRFTKVPWSADPTGWRLLWQSDNGILTLWQKG